MRFQKVFYLCIFAVTVCTSQSEKAVSLDKVDNNNIFYKKTQKFLPAKFSPEPVKKHSFGIEGGDLRLYSSGFQQGSAVLVEVNCREGSGLKISAPRFRFDGSDVILEESRRGYSGLFAINPDRESGTAGFTLEYRINRRRYAYSSQIKVVDAEFPVSVRSLDLGPHSDVTTYEDPTIKKQIRNDREKRGKALSATGKNMLGSAMSHPRDTHHITSPFWSQRRYQRFRIIDGRKIDYPDTVRVHRGLDLRGEDGSDVYAMGRGRVVLAEKMFLEGNIVIIDHGNRVFTYYMHMSELKVEPGDIVQAGQRIGLVGSTGVSTGAHLHVSVLINGVQVDPMSFLSLPVSY